MDEELQEYYEEIVWCLVHLGGMTEEQAHERIDDSKLFEFSDQDERNYFFHEEPYYYAMSMPHGRERPYWHNDPALWPPSEEYRSGDRERLLARRDRRAGW